MSQAPRGVICSLSDCMYFVRLPEAPTRAFCKHPEVYSNPHSGNCPFYRMDWQRKAEQVTKGMP